MLLAVALAVGLTARLLHNPAVVVVMVRLLQQAALAQAPLADRVLPVALLGLQTPEEVLMLDCLARGVRDVPQLVFPLRVVVITVALQQVAAAVDLARLALR